ncbi:hypothetical protein [Moorena sp. SIO3A2]|uniref:hypothetical protein n=1 Tax=Moorena sp. SIO3A2 TaxID=2607841 RepID=UPI0013B631E1|nr:hypothetical protein [Moorena sp. SIO3A2]NER90334.1 hypothetical protein [Moorena sp. SIO3A2]
MTPEQIQELIKENKKLKKDNQRLGWITDENKRQCGHWVRYVNELRNFIESIGYAADMPQVDFDKYDWDDRKKVYPVNKYLVKYSLVIQHQWFEDVKKFIDLPPKENPMQLFKKLRADLPSAINLFQTDVTNEEVYSIRMSLQDANQVIFSQETEWEHIEDYGDHYL